MVKKREIQNSHYWTGEVNHIQSSNCRSSVILPQNEEPSVTILSLNLREKESRENGEYYLLLMPLQLGISH